ncbi:hypothetical protein OG754_00470 [Streptomyces decoyicus]
MSAAQQERLRELEELPHRREEQEVELLTLAWLIDHADPERGWQWAAQGARRRRPVNWAMNGELGKEGRADPLDEHLAELRACLPARAELLGGADDPRPVSALESLALRLGLLPGDDAPVDGADPRGTGLRLCLDHTGSPPTSTVAVNAGFTAAVVNASP